MIYLLNGKAQSGKDTAFQIIEEYRGGCVRLAFADALKDICKHFFSWNGLKDDKGRMLLINVGQIMRNEVEFKEGKFWFDQRSYNPRDVIYDNYTILDIFNILHKNFTPDQSFWVSHVIEQIYEKNNEEEKIPLFIITDFRFKNEYNIMVSEFGLRGVRTIKIVRGDSLSINDRSETELDDFKFDFYIRNDGSLEEFKENLIDLLFKKR